MTLSIDDAQIHFKKHPDGKTTFTIRKKSRIGNYTPAGDFTIEQNDLTPIFTDRAINRIKKETRIKIIEQIKRIVNEQEQDQLNT